MINFSQLNMDGVWVDEEDLYPDALRDSFDVCPLCGEDPCVCIVSNKEPTQEKLC